jgi:hypothetical protein
MYIKSWIASGFAFAMTCREEPHNDAFARHAFLHVMLPCTSLRAACGEAIQIYRGNKQKQKKQKS